MTLMDRVGDFSRSSVACEKVNPITRLWRYGSTLLILLLISELCAMDNTASLIVIRLLPVDSISVTLFKSNFAGDDQTPLANMDIAELLVPLNATGKPIHTVPSGHDESIKDPAFIDLQRLDPGIFYAKWSPGRDQMHKMMDLFDSAEVKSFVVKTKLDVEGRVNLGYGEIDSEYKVVVMRVVD